MILSPRRQTRILVFLLWRPDSFTGLRAFTALPLLEVYSFFHCPYGVLRSSGVRLETAWVYRHSSSSPLLVVHFTVFWSRWGHPHLPPPSPPSCSFFQNVLSWSPRDGLSDAGLVLRQERVRVDLQREKDYRLFTYSLIHLFTYSRSTTR